MVRESVPEFDEAHQFSVLIAAGQIGVGIAQTAAFLLQSEEGLDAGAGRTAGRDVVAIEPGRITPVRDGMEVHREGVGRGKQYLSQSGYPPFEQCPLVFARGPIGIVDCVRLLGEDVQTGEQAQGFVEIEVVDMSASFFVEELERQQG